jgi:ABC-type spermidine/putrescine transport system permease subunit I
MTSPLIGHESGGSTASRGMRPAWLLAPAIALYGGLGLFPLVAIVRMSFSDGLGAYARVFGDPLLRPTLVNTLVISVETTLAAVAIGYYLAMTMWRCSARTRLVLLALVLLPFWTSGLVKNFAWSVLLQDQGLVNRALLEVGVVQQPVALLHNRFAVVVGMVHYVLPFAIFPIYSAFLAIDPALERAARSLGASPLGAIWRVIVPATMPGIYAAALITFIVSTSFYLTPAILGSPRDMMIANLVDSYTRESVDFAGAAALAVLLMATITLLFLLSRLLPMEDRYGRR